MHEDQSRDFPVPLSPCGIPGTARAYSLNVTVAPGGYPGFDEVADRGGAVAGLNP
jgi:hypothetical protein